MTEVTVTAALSRAPHWSLNQSEDEQRTYIEQSKAAFAAAILACEGKTDQRANARSFATSIDRVKLLYNQVAVWEAVNHFLPSNAPWSVVVRVQPFCLAVRDLEENFETAQKALDRYITSRELPPGKRPSDWNIKKKRKVPAWR